MRYFIRLIILAVLAISAQAQAGSVALSPGTGVAVGSSGYTTANNFVGSFSSAAFNSTFTTAVNGRSVTMPASMRLASNAGQFAVAAVRLNPAGLVTGAVAAWLLTEGIQYVNGQLVKESAPAQGAPLPTLSGSSPTSCSQLACMAGVTCAGDSWIAANGYVTCWPKNAQRVYVKMTYGANTPFSPTGASEAITSNVNWQCPAGYSYSGSTFGCVPAAQPATQADWDSVAAKPVPDAAAQQIAQSGNPLPLQNPQFNPASQNVPMSDPYTDPATNQRVRDMARVTPSADGKTAEVSPYKTPVDAAGNPQTDANGNPVTQEETNPCKLNPEAAGCAPLDDVPDHELTNNNKTLSLVPLPGFGPDSASCPADQVLFTKGGQSITWSWSKFCTFSLGIRPLVLGFAWIAAIMIVVGVARREA